MPIDGILTLVFLGVPILILLLAMWGIHDRYRFLAKHGYCLKCKYNLKGTIAAGRTECPECGEPIRSP